MKRKEIEQQLMKNDSTILSFPDRGNEWGDNKWRGNCSGWIPAFLIWKYNVQKMGEVFSGSGTTADVCRDMGIDFIGADLNPTPVRSNILSLDAIKDDVPEQFLGCDHIFMHPPYGLEIGIPYAGSMYKDPSGELSKSDLGQMQWDVFIRTLNKVVMKYYAAMEPGARMSILMGDVRKKGVCHSMLKDIVQPGQLEQIIIKAQHNCVSDGRYYGNHKNWTPIVHEYLMIIKKLSAYLVDFTLPTHHEMDIRDSKSATWRDLVMAALYELGEATDQEIYDALEGHEKCLANPNWKAKARQTLQSLRDSGCACSRSRGVWAAAA